MRFFSRLQSNDSAASLLAPAGLTVSLLTNNGRARFYGPGTTIQGQVHLHLARSSSFPCSLKVVFACHQTSAQPPQEPGATSSSLASPSPVIFEVEHTLIQDELLNPCRRTHPLHFSIKLPLCNYPPSLECGPDGPSVRFSVHAELSTLSPSQREGCRSVLSSAKSPSVTVMYLPMVPTTLPHNRLAAPSQSYNAQLGAINASVECTGAVCIGESVAMVLVVDNKSQTDLQNIHLSLVRSISLVGRPALHSTVHETTVPTPRSTNKGTAWKQQLQFRLPTNIGLVPSIDETVMPSCHIQYSLYISLPTPQKYGSLVSRLRRRPTLDLTAIPTPSQRSSIIDSKPSDMHTGVTAPFSSSTPFVLQFPPIPITVGSIPSHAESRRFKFGIPTYTEVQDQPTFVRDRFEEEMLQHLSSLESLVVDEDDEEPDIDGLVRAAQRRMSSSSSSETDEEEDADNSKIPARFRGIVYRPSVSKSGLSTPPSSPPRAPSALNSDSMDWISSNKPTAPQRTPLPKARGISRDVLLGKYQNRPHEGQQGLNIHVPVEHQ
ncbi:hypothetical protein EMPS_02045 [Entomortierella parvispora]|uniref:Arrestin C-terminal-like domain-containing protein n=1 Tax=Entomortierella parvispora TaxID=205924 RepID=A0A9P3LTD2_9FUNG|nr:hypothetical protein EMPS_02045 [Entomortierella parvispora]